MTTVGNVGIGLIILLLLWIITLIVFVVGVKVQSNISWIALGLATTITIILLIIPTDKGSVEEVETTEKDYLIIYKDLLLAFLMTSSLLGFAVFFIVHCIVPIRPRPIKTFDKDD